MTGGMVGQLSCMGQSSVAVTATNATRISPYHDSWGSNASRRYIIPIATRLFFLTADVSLNNNTADDASIRLRLNNSNVNQIVILDQATGVFRDATNTDETTVDDVVQWFYGEGNNSIQTTSMSMGVG